MAPWLKDSNGNDVFDSVNSPLSGSPIFNPIDVSQTLGGVAGSDGQNAGNVVDNANDALEGAMNLPGMPGATSDSGTDVIDQLSDYQQNYESSGGSDSVVGGSDPPSQNPWNMEGLGMLAGIVVAAVSLYLLAPVLELATEVIDEK